MTERVAILPFAELRGDQVYGLLRLRSAIFVVEQKCLFLDADGNDVHPETLHVIVGADPLRPLATARLLPVGMADGPASAPDGRSIGRVVSDPAARGRGLAGLMMDAFVERSGHELLTLNAQARLEPFYGRWGFVRSGENFLEDDIWHVPMRRPAGAGAPAA